MSGSPSEVSPAVECADSGLQALLSEVRGRGEWEEELGSRQRAERLEEYLDNCSKAIDQIGTHQGLQGPFPGGGGGRWEQVSHAHAAVLGELVLVKAWTPYIKIAKGKIDRVRRKQSPDPLKDLDRLLNRLTNRIVDLGRSVELLSRGQFGLVRSPITQLEPLKTADERKRERSEEAKATIEQLSVDFEAAADRKELESIASVQAHVSVARFLKGAGETLAYIKIQLDNPKYSEPFLSQLNYVNQQFTVMRTIADSLTDSSISSEERSPDGRSQVDPAEHDNIRNATSALRKEIINLLGWCEIPLTDIVYFSSVAKRHSRTTHPWPAMSERKANIYGLL